MEGSVPERGQRDLSQLDQRVRGFRKGEPVRCQGVHAAFGQVLNFFKNTRAFGAGSGRANNMVVVLQQRFRFEEFLRNLLV